MAANRPFNERKKPQGYLDKEDDSFLDAFALTQGSYNVLVNDEGKVVTRKGMTRLGDASSTGKALVSAYQWETSTARNIDLRSQYDKLQVLYNSTWRDILTGIKTDTQFAFAKWWDRTEIKDRLLMVNGTTNILHWTGGMTEAFSVTANTITKKYTAQSAVADPFVFTAATRTLFQSGAVVSFVSQEFVAGDKVRIAGTTSNNGVFTILSVTADTITFVATDTIVNETIATTACLVGVLGKETWAAERFTASGTKQVKIGSVTYTYTGGENTPTLTGVTPNPTGVVNAGDFAYQVVQQAAPTGGDFVANTKLDVLAVNINQAYFGNSLNRTLFLSKQSNFLDCGYTSTVRKTGEGGTVYLDNNLVGIAPNEGDTFVSAGTSDLYRVYFEAFSDGGTNSGELLRVKKLATSNGQGAVSANAFIKIKNGVLYLSNEKTIDFLGNVENIASTQNKPLSDPIKRLLSALDVRSASGVYSKNYVFILLPYSSALLLYDVQRGYWQPPQYISGSCLSVYKDSSGNEYVVAHSNSKDESYKLFTGMTDNGAPISYSACFTIETSGTRSARKTYDEAFIEALCNASAKNVQVDVKRGYRGSGGSHSFTFGFDDDAKHLEMPAYPSGIGSTPFGYSPLGSFIPDATIDPEIGDLRKVYKVSGTDEQETFVTQFQFTNAELGAYFELICHGLNSKAATTSNVDIKA